MLRQSNKHTIRRYYEQFPRDPSLEDALFDTNYSHSPDLSSGPEGVREARALALKKFGDELAASLHNLISEGDLVVAEVAFSGRGEAMRQINWYRVIDGQIVERWGVEGHSDFEPIHSVQSLADACAIEANKNIVRRYYQEIVDNPDVADELFAPEHMHYPGLGPGPEGVKELIRMATIKFGDDMAVGLKQLIAEGDLVAADFTLSGQGNYTREMCIFRVAKGKIVARSCVYCDTPPHE